MASREKGFKVQDSKGGTMIFLALQTRLSPIDIVLSCVSNGVKVISLSSARPAHDRRRIFNPVDLRYKTRIVTVDSYKLFKLKWRVLAESKFKYIVFVHDHVEDIYDMPTVDDAFISGRLLRILKRTDRDDYEPAEERPADRSRLAAYMKAQQQISMIQKINMKLYTVRIKEDRDKMRKDIMIYLAGGYKTLPSYIEKYSGIFALITDPMVSRLRSAVVRAFKVGPDEASAETQIDRFDLAYVMAAVKKVEHPKK